MPLNANAEQMIIDRIQWVDATIRAKHVGRVKADNARFELRGDDAARSSAYAKELKHEIAALEVEKRVLEELLTPDIGVSETYAR